MNITNLGESIEIGSAANQSFTSLGNSFDDFLNILVTQLENQDPLEPLQPQEFTEQLVQFTSVEQSIATNQNLQDLITLAATNQFSTAVGYIGKNIEADGRESILQNSTASWNYELDEKSDSTALTIKDSNGQPVYTTSGATGTGQNSYAWDGKNNNGEILPDGAYSLEVTAVNSDDMPVNVSTTISGKVNAVEVAGGTLVLKIGDLDIPVASLVKVSETE